MMNNDIKWTKEKPCVKQLGLSPGYMRAKEIMQVEQEVDEFLENLHWFAERKTYE